MCTRLYINKGENLSPKHKTNKVKVNYSSFLPGPIISVEYSLCSARTHPPFLIVALLWAEGNTALSSLSNNGDRSRPNFEVQDFPRD